MMRTTDQLTDPTLRMHLMQGPAIESLDNITRLAARLLGLPAAALSFSDATCQWLRAPTAPLPPMTPRAASPCSRIADTREPLVIPDLATHPDFQSGLLATIGMRCYAGVPLLDANRTALGALCVMGPRPQTATLHQLALLQELAVLAMDAIALHRAARVDPVSGLPNRQSLLELLSGLPPNEPRQLAMLDLAHPDELSHMLQTVGSASLEHMIHQDCTALQTLLANAARIFHVAPTQFALLAPPGTDPGELALRLHAQLSRAGLGRDALFSTTCTLGLATITPGLTAPPEMLRNANTALDDARAKRTPIGVYSPEQDEGRHRAFTLLNDFAAALATNTRDDGNGLRLVFQPRLELASGRCVGVEALLRWTHPTLGEIQPAEFVRLVERTTMARGLMHWVLDNALAQLTAWRKADLLLQLSVNVSPANLEDDDFANHVLAALDAARLPSTALELEITESALLDEAGPSLQNLRTLSDAGVRIAIDDFGTGYSALSYLHRLPADVIKIDQSFVRALSQGGPDEARTRTLVATIIALSHDLGYRVVAEGIETQATADLLLRLNCDEVQGYWFARPMHPAAFATWFTQRAWIATPRWKTVAAASIISA